ncbi:unnamed protein product [Lactuca saligna]|uniref:Transposase (putative) gypsy type domain-containing protein n=1 Tax=Lactuca saligna TaxID=75948 RepID=A0AA35ZE34_LACSI|nr:unnamed protein product [Lactuca saligna]
MVTGEIPSRMATITITLDNTSVCIIAATVTLHLTDRLALLSMKEYQVSSSSVWLVAQPHDPRGQGVEFTSAGSSISPPPPGKVGGFLKTLDAGIRFPLTDFQEEVLQKDGYSLQMLTPNAVNKVVAFEMICRANGYVPDYFVFKFFFRFSLTGDKCTFSARLGGHALVPDGRTRKNWQDKWLWVNQELVGSGRYRANAFSDTIPKLFPHNQEVTDYLKNMQVIAEDYSEALLSGVGMSPSWRRHGKMAVFYSVIDEGTPEDAAGREMVLVNDIDVGGNEKDHGASGDDRAGVRGDDVDDVVDDREVSGGLAGKVGEDDVVEGDVIGDKAVGDGSEP